MSRLGPSPILLDSPTLFPEMSLRIETVGPKVTSKFQDHSCHMEADMTQERL